MSTPKHDSAKDCAALRREFDRLTDSYFILLMENERLKANLRAIDATNRELRLAIMQIPIRVQS